MAKVSLIIPVYGVEKYIKRCVESLFKQTLDDLEYIFVDDCTKDHSIEVLEKVLSDYPNRKNQVRIVRHDKNKGLPIARQTGLSYATGEYIAHCDSDDWVDISMYEKMYEKAKKEDADVVTCCYYEGNESLKKEHSVLEYKDKESMLAAMLMHKTPVSVWNKLIKRSLYENNTLVYPVNNYGEDLALMIQLIHRSHKISHISSPLYFYFSNQASITKKITPDNLMKNWTDMTANTQIVLNFLNSVDESKKYEYEIAMLKEECRSILLPIISMTNNRREYLNQYPDLSYSITDIFKKNISLFAGRYWLVLLGLYPIGVRVKTLLKSI